MNKNKIMAILIAVTAACMIIGSLHHMLGAFRIHTHAEAGAPVEIVEEQTDENEAKRTLSEAEEQPQQEEAEADKASSKEEAEADKASSKEEAETDKASVKEETDTAEKTSEKETDAAEEKEASTNKTTDLNKVHADIDIADLTIREGEELHVDFQGDQDFEPEVTQKNGVLTITQRVESRWFNIFKNNTKNIKITVTVPEGTELEELKTELDLGDTRLENMKVSHCSVSTNLGDVKCEDCSFADIRIVSAMGDVHMNDCVFKELEVQQDLGDVDISTPQDLSHADLVLETDLGDVSVNGQNQESKFSLSGDGEIRVVVENDLGDIDLDYAA